MVANIKIFVVDASYVLSSLLPDEQSPESDDLIKRHIKGEIELISVNIFELEVFNGLRSATLQKRLEEANILAIAEKFLKLGIRCEVVDAYEAFQLAIAENLSVYDASYVYLARAGNTKLFTLDKRLGKLAG